MNQKFVSNSNYVFRRILNSEDCLDILKNLIEAILDINIKEISLNPYLKKIEKYLPKEENFGIADVRVTTAENEEINIVNYYNKLDIKEESRVIFNLPKENSIRTIIKYLKLKETNPKYPRRYSEIIKKDI